MASATTGGSAPGPDRSDRSTPDGDRRLRHPVLIVILLVLFSEVFAFEFTVVAPGLPEIAAAFDTTRVNLVMAVPLLSGALAVPLLSKWADVHGKKRALLIGALAFGAASLLCALTSSYSLFLLGRAVQSVGMVGTVVSYGLVRDLLPPRWVPIGIGGLGVGFGTSAVLGPLIGGSLIEGFGFRSVFWFLLVYVIVVGLLLLLLVPETPVRMNQRVDLPGAALLGLGVSALLFAVNVPVWRWGTAVLGLVLLVLFVLFERNRSQPFISIPLLARPAMAMTLIAAAAVGFVVGAQAVLLPLLLRTPAVPGAEHGLGMSALEYAVNFSLVMGTCAGVCGLLSGWMSRRLGPRAALLVSTTGWTVAMGLLAAGFADRHGTVVLVAAAMGIGQGFYYAAVANLVIEAVPARVQGVSASMKYTIEQGMGSIAGTVVGAVIATDVITTLPSGDIVHGAAGFRAAFLVLALAGALGLVVTWLMRHGRTPATGGLAPDAAGDPSSHPDQRDTENSG